MLTNKIKNKKKCRPSLGYLNEKTSSKFILGLKHLNLKQVWISMKISGSIINSFHMKTIYHFMAIQILWQVPLEIQVVLKIYLNTRGLSTLRNFLFNYYRKQRSEQNTYLNLRPICKVHLVQHYDPPRGRWVVSQLLILR